MQGKILGGKGNLGVIRAEDGNRYSFLLGELHNPQNKTLNELIGCEVDFEIAQGAAVDIYITELTQSAQSQNFFSKTTQSISKIYSQHISLSPELQNIKTKAYVFCVLSSLFFVIFYCCLSYATNKPMRAGIGGINVILVLAGIFFFIIWGVLLGSALQSLERLSKNTILTQNFWKYLGASLGLFLIAICLCLCIPSLEEVVVDPNTGIPKAANRGVEIFAVLLFYLFPIVAIYCNVVRYEIHKELEAITQQPLFMWAFWFSVTVIGLPVAPILYIIAWVRVKAVTETSKL